MIFRRIVLTAAMIIFGGLTLSPALASALDCSNPQTAQTQIQCGANDASGNSGSQNAGTTLNDTITSVINILSIIVGIVAVIMIIIAGFRYITSGGKQESVAAAKNGLLYAIIGLVIAALAQVIARFVLTSVTK